MAPKTKMTAEEVAAERATNPRDVIIIPGTLSRLPIDQFENWKAARQLAFKRGTIRR